MVSKMLDGSSIYPENTRLRKSVEQGRTVFDVLQASVQSDDNPPTLNSPEAEPTFRLFRGDHAQELTQICDCLRSAKEYAANDSQKRYIEQLQTSFEAGDIESYKESQRIWVTDVAPSVETIFGFVEPYRDPYGTRAEFEGLVAFVDTQETQVLTKLVDSSTKFIRRLPWAGHSQENNGKGPFEKESFEPPDFTSIHGRTSYYPSILCRFDH